MPNYILSFNKSNKLTNFPRFCICSKEIDDDNELTTISTKTYLQSDGTFETVSQMIFTATRFENGVSMRCEADNVVMRDDSDKPIHDTLLLEVMCKFLIDFFAASKLVGSLCDWFFFVCLFR